MGVIRRSSNLSSPYESIEDVLDNIENVEENSEPEIRRPRKIKHRSARPQAVGGVNNSYSSTLKSGKKKKRIDNSNYLLSLADPDEAKELTIHDFIPQNVSVFSQMLTQRESMEIWNEFINCTTDNEKWYQKTVSDSSQHADNDDNFDSRSRHPAYSAADCFKKIDGDLRCMLKKHVPLGILINLEKDLVEFFINRPQSIYHCHIPNSFERLMVHGLSQYMDLLSLSYNRNGSRWTRVLNKNQNFHLPSTLLSSYLERRLSHSIDYATACL